MFNVDVKIPSAADINPARFYGLIDLMRSIDNNKLMMLTEAISKMRDASSIMDAEAESLARSNNAMLQEIRATTRMRNPLEDLEDMENDFSNYRHNLSANNFLRVAFEITVRYQSFFRAIISTAEDLIPQPIMISDERFDGKGNDLQRLMSFQVENQINSSCINRFSNAVMNLEQLTELTYKLAQRDISWLLEDYYRSLLNRHSSGGMEIFKDPIVTDVAMAIYENIDAHGEIEAGKNPDEVSAYSVRKAQVIGEAISGGAAKSFITTPGFFMSFISSSLHSFWNMSSVLTGMFENEIVKVKELTNAKKSNRSYRNPISESEFNSIVDRLEDVNPMNIVYKPNTKLLSSEERFEQNFRNETIKTITEMLSNGFDTNKVSELIQFVLKRKKELKAYYQDENSFYVCKIGAGNPFSGEAPGALTIIPSERPNILLDDIIGSGFDDVKSFINEIESSSKWHDLFIATSPSKTADKSNVLLVGPQGCGKSEILRSVAGDKKSIGVYAQGSDFNTCWKGEMEKNPKRLFECALKLHKNSGKHVHILIDEIDSVLRKPELSRNGDSNLTLEFQTLMDGVVHYPSLSVWGATNTPQNIPIAMLRRFSKVIICGKLTNDHRIQLLKNFTDYIPTSSELNNNVWSALAQRLEGATGDVIRKVADHIWREKMTWFVNNNQAEAEKLVKWLNKDHKFEINKLTTEQRAKFKSKLDKFISVSPQDIDTSITIHLENIAIRNEIDTAVKTYANAESFLEQLKNKNPNV
jgi:ATP-dependent 26S proteasome regulatory subunit